MRSAVLGWAFVSESKKKHDVGLGRKKLRDGIKYILLFFLFFFFFVPVPIDFIKSSNNKNNILGTTISVAAMVWAPPHKGKEFKSPHGRLGS